MFPVSNYIFLFLWAFAGGITQALTGFGSGIVMMIYLPSILPLSQAASLSGAIGCIQLAYMAYTYRKHAQLRRVFTPFAFYMFFSFCAIRFSVGRDLDGMKVLFGAFLVCMSIYFTFFQKRVSVKGTWKSAVVCGSLSGTVSGLFGIGGPPMAIYYLSILGNDKLAYLGTLQVFFFLTNSYNLIVRVFSGIYTGDLLPLTLIGAVGILCGSKTGSLIVSRIDANTMKKLIYLFTACAGMYYIIQNI